MHIQDLRVNGLVGPLGVDNDPFFSWKVSAEERNVLLAHAQVEVASDAGVIWDSGKLATPGVPLIAYDGPGLAAKISYRWRVRVWDQHDIVSSWSPWVAFDTGLRGAGFGEAQWIRLDEETPVGVKAPVQYLRTEFELTAPVKRARVYSTALGWYRLSVNGADATGPGYYPGFTAFEKRVEYQARDITDLVRQGGNAVGIVLSDGRYRGRIGAQAQPAVYGNRTAAIARLEIEQEDGRVITVVTDADWDGGHGSIVDSDPRAGETIDARLRTEWDEVGGGLPEPIAVVAVDESREVVGESSEPMLRQTPLAAVSIQKSATGAVIADFGQNHHGVTRVTLRGPAGSIITVDHSEVLTKDGDVDVSYLLPGSDATSLQILPNVFILSGGTDVFEPAFCTQGYRYASLTIPDGVELVEIVSLPVHADMRYHGRFSSSNPLVDQFHKNVEWSMRGNFIDVPSDCPTRERSGWTGDAQVFARTALLYADASAYLSNWLTDARLQQHSDGTIPDVVPMDADSWRENAERPEILPGFQLPPSGSSGWGDAIVLMPWEIYQATGSLTPLEANYDAMKKWVERLAHMARSARGQGRTGTAQPHEEFLLDTGYHWGEWLEPDGEGDGNNDIFALMSELARTPRAWVATAYFEHSSRILAEIAGLLGKEDDASHFRRYADGARDAWQREYMTDPERLEPDAQGTYVRALEFGLVPEERRQQTADRLVQRIRERGNHLGTGFLSTGILLKQLTQNGYGDVALDVLLQDEAPSWLDQVQRGATTIWETWTGVGPDGTPVMSYNHYSLGAAARWLYENLAGIRQASPGWRTTLIDPFLNERFSHVEASTGTPFGEVSSGWKVTDGRVTLRVTIPAGTTAQVRLDGASLQEATIDGSTLDTAGVNTQHDGAAVTALVGSGIYTFEWQRATAPVLV